jgi:L-seryl-tRNA(Ser) seleniumtransferase
MVGFTEKPSLAEFVELGRRRNIPTFEDLGSGCMTDAGLATQDEPLAIDSIRSGVDIICFSGDKLLGGPQAGIIAGKKIFVEKVRQNPLFRTLRLDKLTISVLEYILAAYLRGESGEIPVVRMLRAGESELKTRAEAFARRAGDIATPTPLKSVVGGGSAPETYLPSWGVAIEIEGVSETELKTRLRDSDPPVIVRLEESRVILDFRTIFEDDEPELLEIIRRCRPQ